MSVSISQIESVDFFRSLAPDLPITSAVKAAPYPLSRTPPWPPAGHVSLPAVVSSERIAPMNAVIRKLIDSDLHPVFAYVYDAFWEPAVSLHAYVTSFLGPCELLGDGWAWLIPPGSGHRGWTVHRDHYGPSRMVTLWVALSDADVNNACIHLVPLDRDPGYLSGRLEEAHTDLAIPLEAKAGTALLWDSHTLHWGGPSTDLARVPRTSFSFTYAAVGPKEGDARVPIDPTTSFSFKQRLDVIASMIATYRKQERLSDTIDGWAKVVASLGVILRKGR